MKKKTEYKYEEVTGKIIKAAFAVHNALGCGFLEKVYERALIKEFDDLNLEFETQKSFKICYKGDKVGTYTADMVVEDKVIVELKVVNFLLDIHKAQVLNYLKASQKEVALLLNFAKPKLEYRRVVL